MKTQIYIRTNISQVLWEDNHELNKEDSNKWLIPILLNKPILQRQQALILAKKIQDWIENWASFTCAWLHTYLTNASIENMYFPKGSQPHIKCTSSSFLVFILNKFGGY